MPLTAVAAAATGLVITLALFTAIWVGSLVRRDASLVDRFWGAGFAVVGLWYWVTAPGSGSDSVRTLVLVLTAVWGLRLSAYLTWRNWGKGEDYRYQQMRARGGPGFGLRSLVTVHWLQAGILWIVSLVLLGAIRGGGGTGSPLVWVGLLLWAVGFWFEAVGDWQLSRFRADPANRGQVLDRGVWRYTRHPNYFGDACIWWGFYAIAGAGGWWWTGVGAALMTVLLVRVSGVALLERRLEETKPAYRDYVARTSAFVPWRKKGRGAGEPGRG